MKSFTFVTLAAAIIAFSCLYSPTSSVNALPGGAPRCIINQTTITNGITRPGHGPMTALGFTIAAAQTTYTPGQMMPINLNGLNAFTNGGILAYVSQDSNPLNHVGQFTLTGALRAQTASICTGQNVVNDAPSSTITHMNPLPNTNIATLMWTAPATNVGPVTVNAVVATGNVGAPWMILPVMQLQPAGGANTMTTSVMPPPTSMQPSTSMMQTSAMSSSTPSSMKTTSMMTTSPTTSMSSSMSTSTSSAAPPQTLTIYVAPNVKVVISTIGAAPAASASPMMVGAGAA